MSALSTHRAPQLTLTGQVPSSVDVLVVGVASSNDKDVVVGVPADLEKGWAKKLPGDLTDLVADLGGSSKANDAVVLPKGLLGQSVVAVGVGPVEVTPNALREAVGVAVRKAAGLAKDADVKVAVSLDATDPELLAAIAEGALQGAYTFTKVSGADAPTRVTEVAVVSAAKGRDVNRTVEESVNLSAAVNLARDWINAPANLLYPEVFANEARDQFKGIKNVTVEVLDDKTLAREGYGGLSAVGGGSSRGPRLVRVEYKPRGAKQTLALVGKGITFDSGGLNIKPSEGMYTMKCDMSGAAAVLAATKVIAQLGLNVHVITYAAMAENLPSDTAYRPSDVLSMYGGTTVENVNTDAEGRLVMADALARTKGDAADLVVDVATLTGACIVALGNRIAGLMASDDETADRILDAAEVAGEQFWQLPIPDQLRATLDSKVADLKSGGPRWGGALTAAAFLQRFVAEGQSWAHLDIAGPAWNEESAWGHVSTGGTGFAVSTLVALAAGMEG
ncbi:leucyl aminopeptidase [Aestuariimicrobium ganziense]|uniref:leucyl aminopeptidase n=1 Tax=Aestuariimicrobium ganziense TaxID=2773677 RepID=UPI0019436A65|nr:leucyl aminopeptidase [Aestuariimicrobium ganziense]